MAAAVYPAASAAAMVSNEIRFSGLMRLAPEQVGRWYLVPDFEPTTATGLLVGAWGSVAALVVLADATASITAAGATFSVEIKGFSERFVVLTD